MSEDEQTLERKKVDHLILLVGGNPLPNAVAGSCLLAEGGMITLVYSKTQRRQTAQGKTFKIEGTEKIAQRLRRWFIQEKKATKQVYLQAVDDSDAWDIRNGIRTALRNGSGSVGLHYSGGTKAMAIHAYRAVQEATEEKAIFSYLNPRTLEMFFDAPHGEAERESVGTAVNITLEEMLFLQTNLKLHSKRPYLKTPLLPRTAQEMMRVYVAGDAELADWKSWVNVVAKKYRKSWYDGGIPRNWKPVNDIDDPILESPPTSIGQTLLNELGQAGTVSIQEAWQEYWENGWGYEQDFVEEFLGFLLGGKWLEHYTLDCLQQLSTEFRFHQTLLGIVPSRPKRNPNKEDDSLFELDVAAIRGYQLFAFSCSITSKKNPLKHKLFEAGVRARQLGGDEACTALVSLAQQAQVNELEQDVTQALQSNIKLFGKDDLPYLKERLQDWIETQTGR